MPSQPPRPHHTARNGGDGGAWLLAFLNVILAPSIRSIMWEEMTHSDSQVRGSLHFSVSFCQSWSLWVTLGSVRRRGWGRRDPSEVEEWTNLLTHLGAPATQPRTEAVLAAVHSLAGLLLWLLVWSVLFTTRPQTAKGLFSPLCALWAFLSGTQDSCGSSLPASSSPLLPLLKNVCSFWVPSTEWRLWARRLLRSLSSSALCDQYHHSHWPQYRENDALATPALPRASSVSLGLLLYLAENY